MDKSKPQGGDPLDQLAREAAEGAQFEFNPAAWSAMEKKLAPKRVIPWWKIGGGLGILALILFLIFRPIGEAADVLNENGTTEASKKQVEGSIESAPIKKSKSHGTVAAADSIKKSKVLVGEQSPEVSTEEESVNSASTSRQKLPTSKASSVKPINAKSSVNDNEDASALRADGNRLNESGSENQATSQIQEKSEEPEETNYFDLSQPNQVNDSIGVREADLYGVSFETITPEWFPPEYLFDQSIKPMTLDSGNYRTPEIDSLDKQKRWSFGVLVSLDLSATGLEGFTKPGTMVGLVAEYRLGQNWSIQSGLTYAVKRYSALGTEYNTSAWPGGRSDNLIRAEAVCFVIDIPINLRRYFNAKNGNRWFVGGGVSTYLMLREDYDFEYTRPSPNWSPTGSVKGENNHLMGIANLSFGYETGVSKKFNLGIEPFMKLPLTGIGQGEVKFLSFGANLILKLK